MDYKLRYCKYLTMKNIKNDKAVSKIRYYDRIY